MSGNMTMMSIHSVKNMLGNKTQVDEFEDQAEDFSKDFEVPLTGSIERFGIDLTEIQARVTESILKKFSETSYRGNISPQSKEEYVDSEYGGKTPKILSNVVALPRIRITQAELVESLGIDRSKGGDWNRAVSAFQELSEKQYCFFYDRSSRDSLGKRVFSKDGSAQMEEVTAVDTLFKVSCVKDAKSQKIKYYEITPSPIFLDQRESYFLLVPNNWRDEVRKVYGSKKSSSYTFRFMLFLMYRGEMKRRYRRGDKTPGNWTIEMAPKDVATAIKMPESVVKRNKKRMLSVLEDAYDTAQALGYLVSWERGKDKDKLHLNSLRYLRTGGVEVEPSKVLGSDQKGDQHSEPCMKVYTAYHDVLKRLGPQRKAPGEEERKDQLRFFDDVLDRRTSGDFEKLFAWCETNKYWMRQLGKFSILGDDKIWLEFKSSQLGLFELNKEAATQAMQGVRENGSKINVDVGNKSVQVSFQGGENREILYDSPQFKEDLKKSLVHCHNVELEQKQRHDDVQAASRKFKRK